MEATMLLAIVSFFFFSFTSKFGECASHGIYPPPAVLDGSGNRLQKGDYYVLVAWPRKPLPGTLTASISPLVNRNGTCWVQHKVEIFTIATPSLPVKISPIEPNDDEFIRESTYIDIKFDEAAVSYVCGGSSVWRLGDHPDEVFGQRFVTVGGSGEARTTRFKIEKASRIWPEYNLLFCPGGGELEYLRSSECLNVGIHADDDRSGRLALADSPVPFGFRLYTPPSQYIEMKG